MCKFHNKLFVFTIVLLVNGATSRPASKKKALIERFDDLSDYDIHFDQRQKGEENIRINLDGVFIAWALDDTPNYADELLNLFESFEPSGSGSSSSLPIESDEDLADKYEFDNLASNNKTVKDKVQSVQILNPQLSDDHIIQDNKRDDEIHGIPTETLRNLKSSDYFPGAGEKLKKSKSKIRFLNFLKMFRRDRKQ